MTTRRLLLASMLLNWNVAVQACRVCIANAMRNVSPASLYGLQQHAVFVPPDPTLSASNEGMVPAFFVGGGIDVDDAPFSTIRNIEKRSSSILGMFQDPVESESEEDSVDTSNDNDTKSVSPTNTTEANETQDPASAAMLASLSFYKRIISPLLPPACRFVPTCSQYGVQAIQEFGPVKGAVLIAWRLLRCSPVGGKGYDPPRWPPVHFTYSSY